MKVTDEREARDDDARGNIQGLENRAESTQPALLRFALGLLGS